MVNGFNIHGSKSSRRAGQIPIGNLLHFQVNSWKTANGGIQKWNSREVAHSPPAKGRMNISLELYVLTRWFRHQIRHVCSPSVLRSSPAPGQLGISIHSGRI